VLLVCAALFYAYGPHASIDALGRPVTTYTPSWSEQSDPDVILEVQMHIKSDMTSDHCILNYTIVGGSDKQIVILEAIDGQGRALSGRSDFAKSNATPFEYGNRPYQMWIRTAWEDIVPLHEYIPEAWPFDSYEAPTLVIGINGHVFLRNASLSYQLPNGYEASIRGFDRVPFNDLASKLVTINPPEDWKGYDNYFLSEIVISRTASATTQTLIQVFYFLAVTYILYVTILLGATRVEFLADRLKILVGVAFAFFAFAWGFRQVLPSTVTFWEGCLIGGIVIWGVYEYWKEMMTKSA
jgi:hypothetical protein